MEPQPLTPSRVDLHRNGSILVHFHTSVSGRQKFSFPIPRTCATHALRTMYVHDTRGNSPTLTLPGPPNTNVRDAYALPRWLRLHIGHEIEVIYSRNDWRISGTLLGFSKNAEWNYRNEDGDEGPYTFWIRAGDFVVARTVDDLEDTEIRLKTSAHNVPLALPDSTDNGVLPVVVEVSGNGHGELHVSYDTGFIAHPLFDLHYELDAATALRNGREHATVEVMCRAQIVNKLPFALKDTKVYIMDACVRPEPDAGFNYEVEKVPIPRKDDKEKNDNDNDGDQRHEKLEKDDDDDNVDDNIFRFEETTENVVCKLPAFECILEDTVSLGPGELLSTGLPAISVDIAAVHCLDDGRHMRPSVQITNSSGQVLEAGTWAITYVDNYTETFHAGLQGKEARYHAMFSNNLTIAVDSGVSKRRVAETIVCLRGNELVTRVEWMRTLQYELRNKDKCKNYVVALIKQEMEPGMSKETTARLFDGVGMGEWENGVEPDEVSMDLQRGEVYVAFSLAGEQMRTLGVRQKYFSHEQYLVTGEYSSTLLKRLSRSEVNKKVVETLREIRRVQRKLGDVTEKRKVLAREVGSIQGMLENKGEDDEDNEDNDKVEAFAQMAVKQFVENVERVTERRMMLLEALDTTEEESDEVEEVLAELVEDLRVTISQGSG